MSDSVNIDHIAQLARLDLSEEEKATFAGQIEKIVGHVKKLEELDLEGIEPTAHAVPAGNVYRDDKETREGLSHEAALSNAPQAVNGQFGVPKVVE